MLPEKPKPFFDTRNGCIYEHLVQCYPMECPICHRTEIWWTHQTDEWQPCPDDPRIMEHHSFDHGRCYCYACNTALYGDEHGNATIVRLDQIKGDDDDDHAPLCV